MPLMALASYRSRILPSWIWDEGIIENCRSSPMGLNHFFLIFQCEGSYLTIHWRTVFEISGSDNTTNEGMPSFFS